MVTFKINRSGNNSFSCWCWLLKRSSECCYSCGLGSQCSRIWSHRFWIYLSNNWRWSWKVSSIGAFKISSQCIESWRPAPHTNSVRAERHASGTLWFIWDTGSSSIRYRGSPLGFLIMHQVVNQKIDAKHNKCGNKNPHLEFMKSNLLGSTVALHIISTFLETKSSFCKNS